MHTHGLDQTSEEQPPKKQSAEEDIIPAGTRESIVTSEKGGREIKMMDTITFVDGFQPVQWIFTDL